MNRAGREPAEDVKRRLVAACEEVGLRIDNANMHLMKEAGGRLVYVGASLPEWPHDTPTVSMMAYVMLTGDWPGTVDIRCIGSDKDPVTSSGPWMKGRDRVPVRELIEQLGETLNERAQVVAAVNAGHPGPFRFRRAVWSNTDLLGAADWF
jgi:hypothetical protein